jgi:hypothetical protein
MTQFGEPIEVGEIDKDERKCPFDHDSDDPPDVENILIGEGGELGQKMKNKEGTHLYAKLRQEVKQSILDPRDRPRSFRSIKIKFKIGSGEARPVYPVTCAAHHCIPAQESLKNHKLLQYMCKQDQTHDLKDAKYKHGKVWSNVGYDINGSQNGIYLPGNYAVGGGYGIGVWGSNKDGDNEVPAKATTSVTPVALTGRRYEISLNNRKWLYVSKAVEQGKGQFHDRHADYSKFVQSILTKIWENYENLHKTKIINKECPECEERAKKIKALGIPTPFGLVDRLNKVSDNMKNCLNGTTWRKHIYTSKWGKAYMEAVKAGIPDARAGTL